jgi:glycosyltransferase involved in cell wall biosynthesis
MPGRPLLFYSQWPLGFFNPEGERKAFALSDVGYDVVYVTSAGIRNPRLSRTRKVIDVGLRKLRHRSGVRRSAAHEQLVTGSVLVVPPRQVPVVRKFNVAWVRRQLEAMIPSWNEALAWIRFPTPELVESLPSLRPRAVVYECVDPYHHMPGIVGGWGPRFERAERALIEQADLIVAPTEALAERLASLGGEARVVPHGVSTGLFPWRGPDQREAGPVTVGFVGTLDMRLDVAALRLVATRHPDWRIRLIGRVRDGFHPRSLKGLPNVTVEPVVPQARLGEIVASFDVGLMPYLDEAYYEYTVPVKNLEFMAAGKPAVVTPSRALMPYADLLYFAETPDQYCAQLELALSEDSVELARRRRAVAEANSWERRLAEIQHLARELAPP